MQTVRMSESELWSECINVTIEDDTLTTHYDSLRNDVLQVKCSGVS